MKIGVLGGSFNPPHKVHEIIAQKLIENGYVDKVIFVPTSSFYPKANLISDEERVAMLKLMIAGNKNYTLSKYEFGRRTYTYETLEHFQKENPNDEICFICGSDNLEEMDTWREYDKILSNYKIIVIPRNNDMESLLKKYAKYQQNIIVAQLDTYDLSSTIVREYLKEKDYAKVRNLIRPEVLDFIIENNLYV